jgi:hypothetical protein
VGRAAIARFIRGRASPRRRAQSGSIRRSYVRIKIAEVYRTAGLDGNDGDAVRRAETGAQIAALGNAENECFGIEHGFLYEGSPIVVDDGSDSFTFDPLIYKPTTRPGARLPSTFLKEGVPIYDRLGKYFTLLSFGVQETSALAAAANRRGIPLSVVRIDEPALEPIYGCDMLLVRPDHHIAWRGSSIVDADRILTVATGWDER